MLTVKLKAIFCFESMKGFVEQTTLLIIPFLISVLMFALD